MSGLVHALIDELSDGQAPVLDMMRATTETVLADASVFAVIACADGEPVGLMVLNECTAIYAGGRFGEISELYVRPDMRSRGIAPLLIAAADSLARERGWKRLEVGAPDQPKWNRTLNFYLRNGFDEIGPRLRRLI